MPPVAARAARGAAREIAGGAGRVLRCGGAVGPSLTHRAHYAPPASWRALTMARRIAAPWAGDPAPAPPSHARHTALAIAGAWRRSAAQSRPHISICGATSALPPQSGPGHAWVGPDHVVITAPLPRR